MTYGLIGEKLGHSYSKTIHELLGEYSYELIPLEREKVGEFLGNRSFKGLNVTIPYKQTAMEFCDEISPLAKEIGAVNTMYFDGEGKLCGTNTDYSGFIYALNAADIQVLNKTVLVLGDGATCRTVRKALQDLKASKIYIASRKLDKITEKGKYTVVPYEEFSAISHEIDVAVNSTPVGMYPSTENSPCDLSIFPNCEGIFDVIYNPSITKFLEQGKALGMKVSNGLPMLVAQATAAAGYFTGKGDFFEKENPRIIEKIQSMQG